MYLDSINEIEESSNNIASLSEEKFPISNIPAIFKHKKIVDVSKAVEDLEIAREEWDKITFSVNDSVQDQVATASISCDDVLNYFRTKDMSMFLKHIKPIRHRKGFEALKHWLVGPPKLTVALFSERDLFFAMALCPFDSSDEIHNRVLQTLYKDLTNSDVDCPRYGKHWEEIGFQGTNPETDFRGVGFLGLLQLLYLSHDTSTASLAKKISALSRTERQNFPFCTMGINITRIVLETMREEVLNGECNKKMDVFTIANTFYVAVFLRLYVVWLRQNKTIMDSGYVIKELAVEAKKYSSEMLKELYSYLSDTS